MDRIEELAAHSHERWAAWARYMLDNYTPESIARWRRQIDTPYAELSEDEKDSDREDARGYLSRLEKMAEEDNNPFGKGGPNLTKHVFRAGNAALWLRSIRESDNSS